MFPCLSFCVSVFRPLLVDSLYYLDRILTVVFFLETCLKVIMTHFSSFSLSTVHLCIYVSIYKSNYLSPYVSLYSSIFINLLTNVFLSPAQVVAMGLVAYFSNSWCWLDFVIVAVSIINFAAGLLGADNIPIFKVRLPHHLQGYITPSLSLDSHL